MIKESIKKAVMGENITEVAMESIMGDVMDGKVASSQVGAFVTALRMKGETIEEITGAAKALRTRIKKLRTDSSLLNLDRDDINVEGETVFEIIDRDAAGQTNTFNISTATILIAAGGGVKVARHGNRAVTTYFGAADVLENLGVNLDISVSDVERCIDEIGIGFMFPHLVQGPMKYVASIREETGIRTIFNLIGPLANPADASTHMLGVYDRTLTEKMAEVLLNLGAKSAFVVCGEGTFDEMSTCGFTKYSRLKNGEIESFLTTPEDYGFKRADHKEIRGGNVQENAKIITNILDGEKGPKRDIALLNAGAAFAAYGVDNDIEDGVARAKEIVDSGKAKEKLAGLVRFTTECEPFVRK